MLGQPTLVTRHHACDAKGKALFAKQCVAAVARAVRDDLAGFWEVDDVLVLSVAGPRNVSLSGLEWSANRVQARDKVTVVAKLGQRTCAHAGHDAHVDHDVGGVGEFNADVRDG